MSTRAAGPSSPSPIPLRTQLWRSAERKAAASPTCCAVSASPRSEHGDGHARHRQISCRLLGEMRAGIVPVPLNSCDLGSIRPRSGGCRGRVLFISEALYPVVKDMVGRMPDLEHVVVSGNDAHGHKKLSDELARESETFATAPTRRTSPLLALFVRLDRHAQGRAASAFQPAGDRGDLARQVLGIREDDVCFRRRNCSLPTGSATR